MSPVLAWAVAIACVAAVLPSAVTATAGRLTRSVRDALAASPSAALDPDVAARAVWTVLGLAAPLMALIAAALTAAALAQSGGVFVPGRRPQPPDRTAAMRGALFALVTLAALALALRGQLAPLASATGDAEAAARRGAEITARLGRIAALGALALGALDLLVRRRAWLARLGSSPSDRRRERREDEGAPEMRAEARRVHGALATAPAVGDVTGATLVVTAGTRLAVRLRYDAATDRAPVVLGASSGGPALEVAAHRAGVPTLDVPALAVRLAELRAGDPIPEALYEPVARAIREARAR